MWWSGRKRVSRKHGGPYGGDVRIGDVLLPRHAWLEFAGDNGEPDLHMHFEVRDGRPQCVEIRFTTKPDGRGLRTTDVAGYQLDDITKAVFDSFSMRIVSDEPGNLAAEMTVDPKFRRQARREIDKAVSAPGRTVTRAELEQVAKVYRDNVDKKPVQAVMRDLNYGSERTAARRIKQAEAADLLPPTTPGKRRA